jgi:DNA primase
LSGDEKTAKYVNSPETPIFTKSKIFFGLDKSKRAILDAGYAIICEGQLDLIACFMNGVQNIVAPQGTAFTDQHARIIKRYANEVVLCFDSDNAGQNAIVRSLDNLLASNLAIRVAVIPAPHDPDSFIKANGGEAFRSLVEKSDGYFEYYLKRLRSQNDEKTDKGRMAILRSMLVALQKTANRVVIDKHAHDLTFQLGLSFSSVRDEYHKLLSEQSGRQINNENQPDDSVLAGEAEDETPTRPSNNELHLLKLLFIHEELAPWLVAHLDMNWLAHPLVKQIVETRLAACEHASWQNLAAFLDGCESEFVRSLITEAVADEKPLPNPQVQLADVTLKLRNQFIETQHAALTQKISQPELDDAAKVELLHELQRVKSLKRSPLSPLEKPTA